MSLEHESSLDGADTAPSEEAGSAPASPGQGRAKRRIGRCVASWRSMLATVLVVAAVGVAAVLYVVLYRPDQQVSEAVAHRAVQAASEGSVAVLSYSPDNLDRDFSRAKSYLTGNFLAYYTKFTEQIAVLAQQKNVTETAQVIRAAVSELHPDSAVVLVFINQTATSREKPEPQTTANSARVTVVKVRGSWLISRLDPLS